MSTLEGARAVAARATDKLQRLRDVKPFLIDLSLRENPVGARVGQTLADKQRWLPRLREFGFTNILLGTLDYSLPDDLEVDDDFMIYLRDRQPYELRGGWAFTDVGRLEGPTFVESASMRKIAAYRVPHTLHEVYVTPESDAGYTFAQLMDTLPASIDWLRRELAPDPAGGRAQILVNIVDGCDAFHTQLDDTMRLLELVRDLDVDGISFEDDRGTFFPFQVGAYVEIARTILGPNQKILVHMHGGAGFENASLVEALLAGADGVWGGVPKRAAIIGHGSIGELIANLVRAGNPHMAETYALPQLMPMATALQILDEQQPVPDDLPIFGRNAYRLPLSFFRQASRPQDLPPEVIGGSYHYRVCPVVSDVAVIRGRLVEVLGRAPDDVMTRMIQLMRVSLRAGHRIAWDEPKALTFLYQAAGGR